MADHRNGNPHVRREEPLGAAESRRRDAEHGERHPVDAHGSADDVSIGAERGTPVRVAEHDHRMFPWRAIVVRRERAAECGANAEQIEIVARDEQSPRAPRAVVHLEVHG